MTKQKIITYGFLFFISINISFSAKIKYEDVYKAVLSGDKETAYTMLLAYQKQNPKFANAYFQLGIIAKEWAFEYDPYKDFEYTKLFIYNTKLYFNLAKLYMKDEKNKNRQYYKNAPIIPKGKKLKLDDIEEYINSQVEEIKDYEIHITEIIKYYNKSNNFYNNCVSTFMNINSNYSKIKNIYLSDDPELEKNMKNLETSFDSALYYFDLYKKALNLYPVKNYNQTYFLKDIITYRLDGLTYSGFLNNKIPVWNYKKWVDNVRKVKNEIIKSNRTDIINRDNLLKQKIRELENGEFSDNYPKFKLDEKFVYKIEKFDNNSLLIKLFKLNETKINFLTEYKKEINNPVTLNNFSLIKRSIFCYNLSKQKNKADSINKIFASNINPEQVKKYKNFYMSVYGGMKGLKEYSFRQELFFDAKLKDAFLNFKKHLFLSSFALSDKELTFADTLKINPAKIQAGKNDTEKNKIYITDFIKTKENKTLFTGFFLPENGNKQGITGTTQDNKTVDFLTFSAENGSAQTYFLIGTPHENGFFTVKTEIKNTEISNTLLKYDKNGKITAEYPMPYQKIPRLIKYDEINNIILIVFNGNNFRKINDDTEQIIYHFNPDDQLQTYEVKIEEEGNIFDIIKRNKKLYVFSNFIKYTDLSGKTIYSKAGKEKTKTNILVTIISKGMPEKHVPLFNKTAYFGVKALKLNSNTFNIAGYKADFTEENFDSLKIKELFYQLINPEGKVIYSGWHD